MLSNYYFQNDHHDRYRTADTDWRKTHGGYGDTMKLILYWL